MPTIQYIMIKEIPVFLKTCQYVVLYFYKKCDPESEELNSKIYTVKSKYPSVVIRVVDYDDLCKEKGKEVADKRLMVVGIYYNTEALTFYINPNHALIMKIFYAIDCNVLNSNFILFINSLKDDEGMKKVTMSFESKNIPKRKTKNDEHTKSVTPNIPRQSSLNPFVFLKKISINDLEAAKILCSLKCPIISPYVPNIQHSGRTTLTQGRQSKRLIQKPRSRATVSKKARSLNHRY